MWRGGGGKNGSGASKEHGSDALGEYDSGSSGKHGSGTSRNGSFIIMLASVRFFSLLNCLHLQYTVYKALLLGIGTKFAVQSRQCV